MDSFLAVTGPKADLWLVRTVGMLVTVVGLALLRASREERTASDAWLLGTGSAVGFALVDSIYVMNGTIWVIYLADAVVEVFIAGAWTLSRALAKEKKGEEAAPAAPPRTA